MSKHRAMDNMELSVAHPQEDEFALSMLGQQSLYLTMAFPNRPIIGQRYLDVEQLTPRELAAWKRTLYRFVQQVCFLRRKTVVLKSPTHSFRIKVLAELFPGAKFIHIVRDPYVVYPSTVHLFKTFSRVHGLQRPIYAGLTENVLSTYLDLYRKLEEGREFVDPARFYELRYEDLISEPEAQLRKLYEHLDLGDFEKYLPRLQQYLADKADYRTNTYDVPDEQRARRAAMGRGDRTLRLRLGREDDGRARADRHRRLSQRAATSSISSSTARVAALFDRAADVVTNSRHSRS